MGQRGSVRIEIASSSPLEAGIPRNDGGWRVKRFYVYIMTNERNSVLYTGMTNDIKRRAFEHRTGLVEGFTKRYRIHKLVYFETFADAMSAIRREKQIKGGSRQDKIELIRCRNPRWEDLYDGL